MVEEANGLELLKGIRARVDFVAGERSSLVTAEVVRGVTAALPPGRSPIMIPEAHHHMMMDQPLALVAVLRALLA
jgi:pimeloyl-ACP methyl ester carboxylesterase